MKRKAKSAGLHWRPADEPTLKGMHFWKADGENGSVFWIGQPEPGGFKVFHAVDGDYNNSRPFADVLKTFDEAKAFAAQVARAL